jgi:hypothetical protein
VEVCYQVVVLGTFCWPFQVDLNFKELVFISTKD